MEFSGQTLCRLLVFKRNPPDPPPDTPQGDPSHPAKFPSQIHTLPLCHPCDSLQDISRPQNGQNLLLEFLLVKNGACFRKPHQISPNRNLAQFVEQLTLKTASHRQRNSLSQRGADRRTTLTTGQLHRKSCNWHARKRALAKDRSRSIATNDIQI